MVELSKKNFVNYVENLKKDSNFGDISFKNVSSPENSSWNFFGIDWYLNNNKLLNYDFIQALQKGATLLSVGVGDANLERFICKAFEIPKENITLSDIELHPKVLESGCKNFRFDAGRIWNFKNKFDFIIFPESFQLIYQKTIKTINKTDRFKNEVNEAVKDILSLKLNSRNISFFKDLIEQDAKYVIFQYQIFYNAVNHLNKGGSVIITNYFDSQQLAYFIIKIIEDFPDKISFQRPLNNEGLFIVKKI